MFWLLLVLVVIIVVGVWVAVILTVRFNQLSLNRSLTAEARRQFDAARATRHGIIPVYVAEARRIVGAAPRITDLEAAVATAQAVRTRLDAGVAERVVTDATQAVAAVIRENPAAEAVSGIADDLFIQLDAHETHISAAVRHHNASVRAYTRRRAQVLSAPLRNMFKPIGAIDYAPAALDEHVVSDDPKPGSENYRPGRVGEHP